MDIFIGRILVDAAQTPSVKTKIAELKFVTNLATTYCRSDDFPKQPSSSKAVQKIVQLANDQKSVELRSQARLALISLYNCNTPEVKQYNFSHILCCPRVGARFEIDTELYSVFLHRNTRRDIIEFL